MISKPTENLRCGAKPAIADFLFRQAHNKSKPNASGLMLTDKNGTKGTAFLFTA